MPIIAIKYPYIWVKNTVTNKNDVANKQFAVKQVFSVYKGWATTPISISDMLKNKISLHVTFEIYSQNIND